MAIQEINIGFTPNDGLGDSIRTAFDKANSNFSFLDVARQNLVTGNLTATGQVTFTTSNATPNYWTGAYYINGVQIATVGTLFSGGTVANPTQFTSQAPATSISTGAVQVSGGLGVAGATYLTALSAANVTLTGGMSSATLSVGATSQLSGAVTIGGGLSVTAGGITATTANISAGYPGSGNDQSGTGVDAYQGTFNRMQGTLLTNAQPFVNSLGTLTQLAVTGNISAANINLTWGHVHASNAVITGNLVIGANLLNTGSSTITGNLIAGNVTSAGVGTFNSVYVSTVPNNNSATNKSYVTATVVGFAIGLGS
jgi:hypothetical protein